MIFFTRFPWDHSPCHRELIATLVAHYDLPVPLASSSGGSSTTPFMRERQNADHDAAGGPLAQSGEQGVERQGIGAAGKELVAIDKVEVPSAYGAGNG